MVIYYCGYCKYKHLLLLSGFDGSFVCDACRPTYNYLNGVEW